MLEFDNWQPHVATDEVVIARTPVMALQSIFDDAMPELQWGDELPPLWHWVALPRWAPSHVLASDGHPMKGSFLPPVELPRRMFAGGTVSFHAPLFIGPEAIKREQEVTNVVEKNGSSGRLIIVDVTTRLFDAAGQLAVEEVQNLIYREAAVVSTGSTTGDGSITLDADVPAAYVPTNTPLVRSGEWQWDFTTDPTLLMRFSAATANAHRIHYDWPYATRVEGYPGLVVHGPLMTLTLAEVVRLEGVTGVTRIQHRNLAPLFCAQPAQVRAKEAGAVELVSGDTARTALSYWTA